MGNYCYFLCLVLRSCDKFGSGPGACLQVWKAHTLTGKESEKHLNLLQVFGQIQTWHENFKKVSSPAAVPLIHPLRYLIFVGSNGWQKWQAAQLLLHVVVSSRHIHIVCDIFHQIVAFFSKELLCYCKDTPLHTAHQLTMIWANKVCFPIQMCQYLYLWYS